MVEENAQSEEERKRALHAGIASIRDSAPRFLSLEERERMRQILGVDPGGGIRLHTGPSANQAARALGARAFTAGSDDVFFRDPVFDSTTRAGEALLAHELTHVMEDFAGLSGEGGAQRAAEEPAEERAEAAEERARESFTGDHGAVLSAADMEKLIQKTVSILEKSARKKRERTGG